MKKFMNLLLVGSLLLYNVTGCAYVAENEASAVSEEQSAIYAQVMETASPEAEGYYVVEGKLEQIEKQKISMQTREGQQLCFHLSPETVIYTGENKELISGSDIKVVFDGDLSEKEIENISVIAVSILDEEL